MQGIISTSDGKTKKPKEDREAVQKLTTAESHRHARMEGQGEGALPGWKLPMRARDTATALDTGGEGEKCSGFSLTSPSHLVPSMGWTQLPGRLEHSVCRGVLTNTPVTLWYWAGKGREGSEGNQPRPGTALKSCLPLSQIRMGLSIRLLWRKCFCFVRSLSVSYNILFIPHRDLVR